MRLPPTTALDLEPILEAARRALAAAELEPGGWTRWLGAGREGKADAGTLNPYGCADAINSLYTLGTGLMDEARRRAAVATLHAFQDPETGLFTEATHHTYHVTAHCIAALEILDARPLYPLAGLRPFLEPAGIEGLLEGLNWRESPWSASHQGAGVYAALAITGEGGAEWQARYFAWLAAEIDPESGFWRRNCVSWKPEQGAAPVFHHLASSFHYLFNHEWAHQPLPYPEAMIDSCLRIWREGHYDLCARIGFAEIDWVYCLTRALRQSGHRHDEVKAALAEMAVLYIHRLRETMATQEWPFPDLHNMFGALCALAELQSALPGMLRSAHPLRLVLDRRPFI